MEIDAGDSPMCRIRHTEETKQKMSQVKKGKHLSSLHKLNIGAALKGRHITEEQKIKLSIANMGHKHSDETKKKISISGIGRVAWNKGVPLSESHRSNLSKSLIGKRASAETRKKLSQFQKGRKAGEKHPLAKLTWENVSKIRFEYNFENKSPQELAQKYNVNRRTIAHVIGNTRWEDKNYKRVRFSK